MMGLHRDAVSNLALKEFQEFLQGNGLDGDWLPRQTTLGVRQPYWVSLTFGVALGGVAKTQ